MKGKGFRYLVIEAECSKVVTAENLRAWIDHSNREVRVFRLCGTNDPKELFFRFFGSGYLLVDKFGNNEGV